MRLANGFGGVTKMSGKRRNPWRARKTVGYNDNGKQIYKDVGYFKTKTEAIKALVEYNENPYDLEKNITFAEVFEKFKDFKYETLSKSSINAYNAAFKTAKSLHEIEFNQIKTLHLQEVINSCGAGYGSLRKLKTLFKQLFAIAMQNDIVSKDYSAYIDIGKKTTKLVRKIFTGKEIKALFEKESYIKDIDTILIMIFSGLRIGELLILKKEDIDFEKNIIIGGIKTDAGKDRIIPLNLKIIDFLKLRVSKTKKNDFIFKGKTGVGSLNYRTYKDRFDIIMEQLNMQHNIHDCRHTFASLMADAGADKTAIRKIIGHTSYVTTEKIYTHKSIAALQKEIEKI